MLLIVSINSIMPVHAWGLITHEAIISQSKNVPYQVINYPAFTKGGSVGNDMFYFLPGSENLSILSHMYKDADLPREMLKISTTDKQKAYSYGWLSHVASDKIGHNNYIDPIAGNDQIKHSEVEIGVDGNLIDTTPISFSIPFKIVQTAYKNNYGITISFEQIYDAATVEFLSMYIERDLIKAGLFNPLILKYNDFLQPYKDSISYSEEIINDPTLLNNSDTGSLTISNMVPNIETKKAKIRKDFKDAAIFFIMTHIIEVPVDIDNINHEMTMKEPIINNKYIYENLKDRLKKEIDK
jgi:hypothetical protein